jgi:hypothetical protein
MAWIAEICAPGAATKRQLERMFIMALTEADLERRPERLVNFLAPYSPDRARHCSREQLLDLIGIKVDNLIEDEQIAKAFAADFDDWVAEQAPDSPLAVDRRAAIREQEVGESRGPPPDPKTSTAPTVGAGAPESAEAENPFLRGRDFKNSRDFLSAQQRVLRGREPAPAAGTRRIRFFDSAPGIIARRYKAIGKNTLIATADLEISAWHLRIRGAMLHEKNGKRWIQLPSREWLDADGNRQFAVLIEFLDRAISDRFQTAALAAFDAAALQAQRR